MFLGEQSKTWTENLLEDHFSVLIQSIRDHKDLKGMDKETAQIQVRRTDVLLF